MIKVKHLTLDILKPHHPNLLEFAKSLAGTGSDYQVVLTVMEMDDKTETLEAVIKGDNIDFEAFHAEIKRLGGSLHSIDAVEVVSDEGDISAVPDND